MPPHQVHVSHRQRDERGRQQQDVHGIPAQQRQRPELASAAHHRGDRLAHERRASRDVDRDRCRPIGFLVPRQEVAGQGERHDDQEQRHAGQPGHFARRFVGPEHHDARHVRERGDDDETGAEEMQAANEAAERDVIGHVADAVVGEIRRGHVVHGQDDAADRLQSQEKEQDAPEHEPPVHAGRQRFVEEMSAGGLDPGARVEPVDETRSDAASELHHHLIALDPGGERRERSGRRTRLDGAARGRTCRRDTDTSAPPPRRPRRPGTRGACTSRTAP